MTTDVGLRERVARLEARAEILDCMHRYARGSSFQVVLAG
jgi:hypothetical protein